MFTQPSFRLAIILTALVTAGCDSSSGKDNDEGADAFSVPADILFVVDNSSSTHPYSTALLQGWSNFIDILENDNPSVAFHLAFTTTTVETSGGFTFEDDPGEAGLFTGDVSVVRNGERGNAHQLMQNLGCWSTCWSGYDMPSDVAYVGSTDDCPFPAGGEATTQYVDCLCNDVDYPAGENWDALELCGSGSEMPVEAALMAMCRTVEDPPDVCYHVDSVFRDEWIGTNSGWLRAQTPKHIVLVTDEGDASQQNVGGLYENEDDEPDVYVDAFAEFGRRITFSAIGPTLTCEEAGCTTTCSNVMYPPSRKGANRLKNLADATGGLYLGITQEGESGDGGEACPTADLSNHLTQLARLFAGEGQP